MHTVIRPSYREFVRDGCTSDTELRTAGVPATSDRYLTCWGGTLLTTQLMPYEAADAAFAYTKAGYISDMGVFDNVVGLVGQNLGSLSMQQVAKCQWV